MTTQRKIREVFLDKLTGKRLKCVPVDGHRDTCGRCAYDFVCRKGDTSIACIRSERITDDSVFFIETDEPLTEKL